MTDSIIESFPLTSMDVTDLQQQKLKALFPEVFTESGKIDFDKLRLTLGENVDAGKERFGLNWAGKSVCFQTIKQSSVATLVPARDESVDFDTTENLYIEGDNLEVLKLLQKSYLGKVKMIYIDPPYNTGNDFIYPDNYAENLNTYLEYTGQVDGEGRAISTNKDTDGRFHSKWLNMMYPRLFLAKNLLREDGVIFISIDDSEQSNLKRLCDEVFGEENCIANLIWQHSLQPKGYSGTFSVHHNFVLCYQKSSDFELANLERTDEHNKNYSNSDNDPNGAWRSGDVRNALYRPNLIYPIQTPSGKIIEPPANGWRWSKETLQSKIQSGEIIFSTDETRIIRKIYLNTLDGRTPETILFGKDVGTTREAASEIKIIFDGKQPFDTPKPTGLLKHLSALSGLSRNDTILDFFSGSSTTAHAILDLNKEDGGNRKFIMVQLPEPCDKDSEAFKAGYKNIAEIGKERIRRVINKIKTAQTETEAKADLVDKLNESNAPQDLGFKVFKLQKSNFKVWDANVEKTAEAIQFALDEFVDHINPQAEQEAILFELLLKSGFELTTPIEKLTLSDKTVFSIADGALLICLEKALTHDVISEMAKRSPSRVICLDEGFQNNDQLKTNAVLMMKNHGVEVFRTV